MATRTWLGGTADWISAAAWNGGVPSPGDSAQIASGTAMLLGPEGPVSGVFDAIAVTLGSASAAAPATMQLDGARLGHFLSIQSTTGSGFATLATSGISGDAGSIAANVSGGLLTIQTGGSNGGNFVLLHGGSIAVSNGDTLQLNGVLTDESTLDVGAGSTFIDTGTLDVFSYASFDAGATLTGAGTMEVGLASTLLINGAVGAGEAVKFNGVDGRIQLGDIAGFQATIGAFAMGDIIELDGVVANTASYDAATGLLSVTEIANGATTDIATLHVQGPPNGALMTVADGSTGTRIEYPGQADRKTYQIAAGDVAMGSNVVRATMTTPSGVPITGAGIRIGILSDSFNFLGGANADAQAGLLPLNAASGMSAVTVLKDGTSTSSLDEGRAMAELVHQVAPGAQIYFYTAENGQADFANGITQMVADGVNIIVDDWSFSEEPFFQVSGTVDTAIQAAINSGVSYFTSASNYGNAYYQAPFTATSATLAGVQGPVLAQTFSNGTQLQTITVPGSISTTIALQWDAPFPAAGGSSPDLMEMALYDMNGTFLQMSVQTAGEPEITLNVTPNSSTPTQYQVAIFQTGGMQVLGSVQQFKYMLLGRGAASQDPGGYIDDPAAMNGSGTTHGHDLVPGVNTVGAMAASNAPAYANTPNFTEDFSSSGPGTLLFDSSGNRLATPQSAGKVNFVAPDGIYASSDLSGFQPFFGTSAAAPNAAAVAALMLQANPSLTPAQISADLAQSALTMGLPAATQGAGLIQAQGAVALALATACFASGTRLRTPAGDMAVEDLAKGDLLTTHSGRAMPVKWIGHRRIDCRRHPRPAEILPVRVRAGAFGPNMPARDVVLSPDHAVFLSREGVLVPVRCLIDGHAIAQQQAATITYWHVELDRHDVLLAEGLPVESYLDTGNRHAFANAPGVVALVPDFAGTGIGACAPLVTSGAALACIRARLAATSAEAGSGIRRRVDHR